MQHRLLGRTGPTVSALGLGCMGMSGMYGPADRNESLATLQAAADAGVTLLDTGDFGGWLGVDARPKALKNFLAYSLQRLGVDYIDIYRPARLDPQVPIEDTVGAIADLIKAGFVRHIGLSEVGADTLRRAAAVHPISDLQIEYSLMVEALRKVAAAKGISVAQLAIAWVAQQGDDIIPLIGARRRDRLAEALGSAHVTFAASDLAAIEVAVPKDSAAGARYPSAAMADLDSEK
jgi:aryl-alcohol dehydrogenase-like predicted oxidoreductase